jgi:hypothetical protein
MIWLDGFGYHTAGVNYHDKSGTFANQRRSLTGDLVIIESGLYQKDYTLTLNVSQLELELLRTSFETCHAGSYLRFIDERQLDLDPASGTDSPSHWYSSGVWFTELGEPVPATEALFDPMTHTVFSPYKRFLVQIKLIANTKAHA